MSLLSPERLNLFVAPTGIVAVHVRGGGRIADKRLYPATGSEANGWSGAVAGLGAALREFRVRRAHVVLSNHFVQYELQPWRADLKGAEEEIGLARIGLVETYGPVAEQWRICLSDEPPGRTKVAAAVAADLLGAIEAAAKDADVKLVSLQPYLVAAMNAWRQHFGRDRSAWMVLHEDGRLCFALIERGRWRWVRSQRVGADWREQLPDLVENEVLLAGVESLAAEVLVFAPLYPELSLRGGTRLPFRNLQLPAQTAFSPATDGAFGLALIG